MTLFVNFQKKQMFAKWVKDEDWQTEPPKWEQHGWIPLLTSMSLSWQMVWEGWTMLKRPQRLKLEKQLFG